jgi:hypothetical protein
VFYLSLSQSLTLTRFAVVLIVMWQTEKCQIFQGVVAIVLVEVSYLSLLHFKITMKPEANAAATAREHKDLILGVSGNSAAYHRKKITPEVDFTWQPETPQIRP